MSLSVSWLVFERVRLCVCTKGEREKGCEPRKSVIDYSFEEQEQQK